jgi:hypothetical protein
MANTKQKKVFCGNNNEGQRGLSQSCLNTYL